MTHMDPVIDAMYHYDAIDKEQEIYTAALISAEGEINDLCRKGDPSAIVQSAGKTPDWNATRTTLSPSGVTPMRDQTLEEIIFDGLGYANGPSSKDLIKLILDLGFTSEPQSALAERAREILSKTAKQWALHKFEEFTIG